MMSNKLNTATCKIIPIKVLRANLKDFKAQTKEALIKELHKRNSELLKQLALHYASQKEKSVFFFSLPTLPSLSQCKKNIEACKFHDTEDDFIYAGSIVLPKGQSAIITVTAVSQTKEQKNWVDHENLIPLKPRKYRRPFSIFLKLHPKNILEVRTKNYDKALRGARYISRALFDGPNTTELKKLTADVLKQLDPDMRSKHATLKDLNFAGAEEIILKGPDVEQACKELSNRGIIAKEIILHKSHSSQNNIKFYDNGKISFTRDVGDIYETLKKFLENET